MFHCETFEGEIMKANEKVPKYSDIAIWAVWVWFFALTLMLLFSSFDLEKAGQMGDMFGVLNCLFTGLGFAGIYVNLRQQNKQVALLIEQNKGARLETEFATGEQVIKYYVERIKSEHQKLFGDGQHKINHPQFQSLVEGSDDGVKNLIRRWEARALEAMAINPDISTNQELVYTKANIETYKRILAIRKTISEIHDRMISLRDEWLKSPPLA